MPRGRKQRVATSTLPPRYYLGAPAVLEAVRAGRITPTAACLWQIIQAHAWQEGYCDLTDRELAEWLGGLSERQVVNLRQMLAAAGLLDQTANGPGHQERRLLPLPRINLKYISGEIHFTGNGPIKEEEVNLKPGVSLNPPPPPPETTVDATRAMGPDAPRVNKGGVGGINLKYISGEMDFTRNTVQVYSADEATDEAAEGINPKYISGEIDFTRNTVQVYSADEAAEGINPKYSSGEMDFTRNTVQVYSAEIAANPDAACLIGFLVKRGIFPSVAAPLADELLGSLSLADAQIQALATLYAVRAGRDDHGRRLADEQIIGRWVARLRDAVEPPAWALALARAELQGDGEDTGEDADEVTEESPAEELPAGDTIAAPDPPGADLASDTPDELWQQALAQLRLQMTRDTYTACLAATRCLGLETTADGLPCLVVQAAPAAAAWLEVRLKSVIIRTAAAILGQPCTVRFVAGEKTP